MHSWRFQERNGRRQNALEQEEIHPHSRSQDGHDDDLRQVLLLLGNFGLYFRIRALHVVLWLASMLFPAPSNHHRNYSILSGLEEPSRLRHGRVFRRALDSIFYSRPRQVLYQTDNEKGDHSSNHDDWALPVD